MSTSLRSFVIGLLSIGTFALAQEAAGPAQLGRAAKAKCGRWIARLVSAMDNPLDSLKDGQRTIVLAKKEIILSEAQRAVMTAYNALSEDFETALPELAKHVGDDRFSHLYMRNDGVSSRTVGATCESLVRRSIEFYIPVFVRNPESGNEGKKRKIPSFIEHSGGVAKWWESRKGRTIKELQLECIDWTIGKIEENASDYEDEDIKSLNEKRGEIKDSSNGIIPPLELKPYDPGIV